MWGITCWGGLHFPTYGFVGVCAATCCPGPPAIVVHELGSRDDFIQFFNISATCSSFLLSELCCLQQLKHALGPDKPGLAGNG